MISKIGLFCPESEAPMEKWDLYTRNRELTGREQIRGEAIPEGFYHLVVHVWLKNRQGQYLISKRSADRPTYPLFWECTRGSVLLGETSLHGAAREVKEEVGVDLEPETGRLVFSKVRDTAMPNLLDVWLFEEGENGCFQPDLNGAETKEVEEIHWMWPDEIRRLYEGGRMVPSLGYFFSEIEGMLGEVRSR